MKRIVTVLFGLLILQGCGTDSKKTTLPEVIGAPAIDDFSDFLKEVDNIASFKSTQFSPTLESPIDKNKNSIYAATLLMAWNEIKQEINDSIINIESDELELINNSKSYIGVLNKDEYKTSIKVKKGTITAKAHFVKSLPFHEPITEFETPLNFKNSEVKSFGFEGDNKVGRISYYNNDKDFAIRLLPEDREHEFILIKPNTSHPNLNDYYSSYESELLRFKDDSIRWKHHFTNEDTVQVPVINFSIDHNYHNIINTCFSTCTGRDFTVLEAYQKTAFKLNEKGGTVESFSLMIVEEACSEEIGAEEPEPKHLIFNDDFVIFLKRKDADFPYFGLYITNDELMVKFDDQSKD